MTVLVSRVVSFPEIRIAHGVLLYLLLIVGASRDGGRGLAASMLILSYLAVDYFFVPPQHALGEASRAEVLQEAERRRNALLASAVVLADRPVAVDDDAPPLVTHCDFTLWLQILGNLLQNAARYSPSGTAIEIAADADSASHRNVTGAASGVTRPVGFSSLPAPPFPRLLCLAMSG